VTDQNRGRTLGARLVRLVRRTWKRWRTALVLPMSDKAVIARQYREALGRRINFRSPQRFTEKVQWLKAYGRLDRLSGYADKLAARSIVRERIGEHYLVPLLDVWETPEQIEISRLPDSFMMKANHGSGFSFLVENRAAASREDLVAKARRWLSRNYYTAWREPQYRKIVPRVYAEQDIRDGARPIDYRFFCVDGKTQFILVNKFDSERRIFAAYYSLHWNRLGIRREAVEQMREDVPRPAKLAEMQAVAETLAARFPFVRLDLYYSRDRIYFSEFTFTPSNGLIRFIPPELDFEFCKGLDVRAFRGTVRRWAGVKSSPAARR
jgi:hypothetical protein